MGQVIQSGEWPQYHKYSPGLHRELLEGQNLNLHPRPESEPAFLEGLKFERCCPDSHSQFDSLCHNPPFPALQRGSLLVFAFRRTQVHQGQRPLPQPQCEVSRCLFRGERLQASTPVSRWVRPSHRISWARLGVLVIPPRMISQWFISSQENHCRLVKGARVGVALCCYFSRKTKKALTFPCCPGFAHPMWIFTGCQPIQPIVLFEKFHNTHTHTHTHPP
jgi:hypothetical protein